MKSYLFLITNILFVVLLCLGLVVGCGDDDDDEGSPFASTIADNDPSYGFLVNSTSYRLAIDLDETETFTIALDPGMVLSLRLPEGRTHLMHVIVLNDSGRAIASYINAFYINTVPLDNQLKDFICSWFVEFSSEAPLSGFSNNFGS